MSNQARQTAERLNELLKGMSSSGMERLLDFGSGYIRGYRDGKEQRSQSAFPPQDESTALPA